MDGFSFYLMKSGKYEVHVGPPEAIGRLYLTKSLTSEHWDEAPRSRQRDDVQLRKKDEGE